MRYGSVLLAVLLVTAAACGSHSGDSSAIAIVRVGETVRLAVGQSALVENTDIAITFVSVLSDSRCPSDAVCVTAGDAKMRLKASRAGMTPGRADVGLFDQTSLTFQGLEFTVESLDPWPTLAEGTPPMNRYRATIRVRAAISG